jgi:flagellin
MRIQNNVPALNAHRFYTVNQTNVTKSIAKLSSGYRINSAADDAAGLAISEKMRAQIRGLTQASKNTQDAVSLIQTAEGGMQEVDNMLQRIRELVVYASNDTQEMNGLGTSDRQKIQDEITQLAFEIDAMSERVEFNKKRLINGSNQAVPTNGDVGVELQTAKLEAITSQEIYREKQNDLKTAKEAIQSARDALNNAIGDDKINSYLKSLADSTTTGVASAVAYIQNVLADLGRAANQNTITSTGTYTESIPTGLVTSTDEYGVISTGNADGYADLLDNLDAALTSLTSTTDQTADELVTIAYLTEALGASGTIATAASALASGADSAFGRAEAAADDLALAAADLAQKNAAVIEKQGAYDSAPKTPALYFQAGANAGQGIEVSIGSVDTKALGIGLGDGSGTTINVLAASGATINNQLDILDTALSYVTTQRSKLGAIQNRLEYTQSSLEISAENLTNAESRIRDVDMAKEMTNFTKQNILFQASTAMLAQANALPQGVLQLLG